MMKNNLQMTPAQKKITEDHMHLVTTMIHALTRSYGKLSTEEQEELMQNGYLALCRAAISYTPGRSFQTYAQVVIKHAIYDYWRKSIRHQEHFCSLDALLQKEEESSRELTFYDAALSHSTPDQDALQLLISDHLNLMGEKSSHMIQKGIASLLLAQKGYSSADIAKIYHVPSNRVRAWQSKAKKKLQQSQELYALLS